MDSDLCGQPSQHPLPNGKGEIHRTVHRCTGPKIFAPKHEHNHTDRTSYHSNRAIVPFVAIIPFVGRMNADISLLHFIATG